uniref:alkaline phosphatase n=1 Tax=Timema douglasi TaxID=61478 RepID=A0A7R8VMF2_TIMDO|nr:unnamed protein product [Timema douglasi]
MTIRSTNVASTFGYIVDITIYVIFPNSPSGGRIDHAHHYNNAYRALDETLALEAALLAALSMINPAETLVVLTADHSHVMTLGGLATPRGNPILGVDKVSDMDELTSCPSYTRGQQGVDSKMSDMDSFPYSTLLYGNGPGYTQPRTVPSNYTSESEERNSVHGSAVPRQWATHGGEDVPVFAQGPLASVLFSGTFDQSYIPHAIAYAACLGEHAQRCSGGSDNYTQQQQQVVHACASPEVSSVSSPGGVVVVASSVMADDSQTAHGSSRRNVLDDFNLTFLVVVTCATAVYHLAIT